MIVIGGIFFFYPKTDQTIGFPVSTGRPPECLGFMRIEDFTDTSLFICYGIFY